MDYRLSEIEHRYGSQVHILADPILETWLARLCSPKTLQPDINHLVENLYQSLIRLVINREFQKSKVQMPTRMTEVHPHIQYSGEVIDAEQRAVVVNLARAGTWPSHVCYHLLNLVLNPIRVRQDHILASRQTSSSDTVIGTRLEAAKIGGDIQDSMVLFPDPMGATGNTLSAAVEHYKQHVDGQPRRYVALHLIITPEYLKYMKMQHPDVQIYAIRLDRGLSSVDVLSTVPGTRWDEERGLDQKQYIVPGGGGFGEILNNSFV